jgi:hypothetical protein
VGQFLQVGRCDKLMTNSRLLADTLAKDPAIALRQYASFAWFDKPHTSATSRQSAVFHVDTVLHAGSDCGAYTRTCGIEE